MAKSKEEISELISTELFCKGISNKYISVNQEMSVITYHCKNGTKRRLSNPEEFIQALTYLKLIFEYN